MYMRATEDRPGKKGVGGKSVVSGGGVGINNKLDHRCRSGRVQLMRPASSHQQSYHVVESGQRLTAMSACLL